MYTHMCMQLKYGHLLVWCAGSVSDVAKALRDDFFNGGGRAFWQEVTAQSHMCEWGECCLSLTSYTFLDAPSPFPFLGTFRDGPFPIFQPEPRERKQGQTVSLAASLLALPPYPLGIRSGDGFLILVFSSLPGLLLVSTV